MHTDKPMPPLVLFHYTHQKGFNSIKSQLNWHFKATQPKAPQNPKGAYFTTLKPDAPNFYVKTRIPKAKQAYLFAFVDQGDLSLYPGGKGRLKTIFYSPEDYVVVQSRQKYCGKSTDFGGHTHAG